MKTKRWLLAVIGISALFGIILWALSNERDPIYQGKPLSKHLQSCRINGIHFGGGFNQGSINADGGPTEPRLSGPYAGDARAAILNQGTNAFPLLIRMLTWGETRVDQWRRRLAGKYVFPQRIMPTNWVAEWENQTRALVAFQVLGSNAAPAARLIVPLLNNSETAHQAIVALTLIRPHREEYILSLTNVARIRNTSRSGGTPEMLLSEALLALSTFGPKASAAIPFLVNALTSTNGDVQAAAAVALVRVGARAEKVVPLIIKSLPKAEGPLLNSQFGLGMAAATAITREQFLRRELRTKIWALSKYGSKAQSALPVLSTFEESKNDEVQAIVKNAIAKIKDQKSNATPKSP